MRAPPVSSAVRVSAVKVAGGAHRTAAGISASTPSATWGSAAIATPPARADCCVWLERAPPNARPPPLSAAGCPASRPGATPTIAGPATAPATGARSATKGAARRPARVRRHFSAATAAWTREPTPLPAAPAATHAGKIRCAAAGPAGRPAAKANAPAAGRVWTRPTTRDTAEAADWRVCPGPSARTACVRVAARRVVLPLAGASVRICKQIRSIAALAISAARLRNPARRGNAGAPSMRPTSAAGPASPPRPIRPIAERAARRAASGRSASRASAETRSASWRQAGRAPAPCTARERCVAGARATR
jgi:hypothetical protein